MSLPVFHLKKYQIKTLASLRAFLAKAVELNDADTAFYALTKRPFVGPPGLPGLPYVCLRVPTGGGKTHSRCPQRCRGSGHSPSVRESDSALAGSVASDPRTNAIKLAGPIAPKQARTRRPVRRERSRHDRAGGAICQTCGL